MITLIIIAVVWIIGAGLFQPLFSNYLAALCVNCSKGNVYQLDTYDRYGYRNGSKSMEPGMGHDGGTGLALIWPIVAPYVLANILANPAYKTGRSNIKRYWANKQIQESNERLRQMEIEAGL